MMIDTFTALVKSLHTHKSSRNNETINFAKKSADISILASAGLGQLRPSSVINRYQS